MVRSETPFRQESITVREQLRLPCASVTRKLTPVGVEELQRVAVDGDPLRRLQYAGMRHVVAAHQVLRSGRRGERATLADAVRTLQSVAAVRTRPRPVSAEHQHRI